MLNKKNVLLSLWVIIFALCIHCDNKGTDPDHTPALAGSYGLVSLYDKASQVNFLAEQSNKDGDVTTTITGELLLTDDNYDMTIKLTVEYAGISSTDQMIDYGSYEVKDGDTIKGYSQANEDQFTMSYEIDGDLLTLEDDESRMVWEKES